MFHYYLLACFGASSGILRMSNTFWQHVSRTAFSAMISIAPAKKMKYYTTEPDLVSRVVLFVEAQGPSSEESL